MKPLALDLCCGLGGWTQGLRASGWDVIGFDIKAQEKYFGKLILCDVREIRGYGYSEISLVVASPPCQEFSYRHLPFGRIKNLPPPDKSIWRACERIARECSAPLILENVKGAEKFMGKAKAHYGSYYLWGDVPVLLPSGKQPHKGFTQHGFRDHAKGKNGRRQFAANAAIIPFELAYWIGECFKFEIK